MYIPDKTDEYLRIDEYTYLDKKSGKQVHRCVGCYKVVSFREFDDNKGYCSGCRDGKNEHLYR